MAFAATPQSDAQVLDVTVTFRGDGVVVGFPPEEPVVSWIGVVDAGGDGHTNHFAVYIYPNGMVPGEYTTTLRFLTGRVSDNGAVSRIKYVDVPVTLTIGVFQLSPASVEYETFQGSATPIPGALTLAIDDGYGWIASSNQPWLTVDPNGTGPGDVAYSVNPANLAPGTYTGTITVTGPAQATSTIELEVRAPILTVDPAELVFTVDSADLPPGQVLQISDELDGADPARDASWSVQSISASWLQMSPTSGVTAPAVDATVSLVAGQLASKANGDYTAYVTLSYTASDNVARSMIVPVTLHLDSPLQSITLSPANPERISGLSAVQFTATGAYATGYSANLTNQVTWSSSNPAVAGVSNDAGTQGLGEPVGPGVATVQAQMPGTAVSGSTTFTVVASIGYAYTTSYGDNRVYQYVIGENGYVEPRSIHPTVATGDGPHAITFTPSGEYAYVSNADSDSISQYTVTAGGDLVPMSPASVAVAGQPFRMTVDSSGQYLYVASPQSSGSDPISQFSIGSDGKLSPLTPPSVAAGQSPWDVAALPTGGHIYVANQFSGGLGHYSIGADGTLTLIGSAGGGFVSVAATPSGNAVYAVSQYGISQYSVGADGVPAPMSTPFVPVGTISEFIVVDPTGQHAYALATYEQKVKHFTIAADGSLTASAATAPNAPYNLGGMALDPSGKYLYVLGRVGDGIVRYAIDENGDLGTPSGFTPTGSYPWGLVVRPGN